MMLPLTQMALDEIAERFGRLADLLSSALGDHERRAEVMADSAALLGEIERLSAALADCWLALDLIARDSPLAGARLHQRGLTTLANDVGSFGHVAAKVLRMQRAPGWQSK